VDERKRHELHRESHEFKVYMTFPHTGHRPDRSIIWPVPGWTLFVIVPEACPPLQAHPVVFPEPVCPCWRPCHRKARRQSERLTRWSGESEVECRSGGKAGAQH
jgi:hypothetical protein